MATARGAVRCVNDEYNVVAGPSSTMVRLRIRTFIYDVLR